MVLTGNGNGKGNPGWQRWLLGIGATVVGSLIINGIVFQRETRKEIAENHVKIERLEQRDENIIKYLQQLSNERMNSLERRIDELERRSR